MSKTLVNDPFLTFAANALQERLTALSAELRKVRKTDDPEAVHDARVASRRLRSGLAPLTEAYPRKKFKRWRRQVKDITRSLGNLRDTEVQQLFVEHRLQEPVAPEDGRAGLELLQQRLQRKRRQEQSQVRQAIDKLRKRETLAAMAAAWQKWQDNSGEGSATDPEVRDTVRPLLLNRLEEVLERQEALDHGEQTTELHRLRIALKQFRYALEIVASAFDGRLDTTIETVKELQTVLGDIHDADVWVVMLPKFIGKQERRFRRANLPAEERDQALADLHALLEDRQAHRTRLHAQLRQRWQALDRTGVWKELRSLLEPAEAMV